MPEQNYPPFASDTGGRTSPRQLNKWIDVSPQGGSLKRTEGYIQLPAFNQAVNWKGYSEIIAAFNFAGPNNFVLTDWKKKVPSSPDYVLCVAYQKGGTVYRYKLCGGGVFYFELTQYSGQIIKKNFRFEIWSVADAVVSQSSAINFYTSVKGHFDYRFGSDFSVKDSGTIVTDFSDLIGTVPAVPSADYIFNPNTGVVLSATHVQTWTDTVAGLVITALDSGGNYTIKGIEFSGGNIGLVSVAGGYMTTTGFINNGLRMYFVVKNTNNFIPVGLPTFLNIKKGANSVINFTTVDGGYTPVTLASDLLTVTGSFVTGITDPFIIEIDIPAYNPYVASMYINMWSCRNTTLNSRLLFQGYFTIPAATDLTDFQFLFGPGKVVGDIFLYNNHDNNFSNVFQYVMYKYYGRLITALPLTFPTNAVVPNNT